MIQEGKAVVSLLARAGWNPAILIQTKFEKELTHPNAGLGHFSPLKLLKYDDENSVWPSWMMAKAWGAMAAPWHPCHRRICESIHIRLPIGSVKDYRISTRKTSSLGRSLASCHRDIRELTSTDGGNA